MKVSMNKKVVSAGFLIKVGNEILIAKPFNNKYWNVPKGKIEDSETAFEAAIRETYEECGISIDSDADVKDLFCGEYLRDKDLHMFMIQLDSKPETTCKSFFYYKGNMVPEMVDFKWVTLEESYNYLNKGLIEYLKARRSLIL